MARLSTGYSFTQSVRTHLRRAGYRYVPQAHNKRVAELNHLLSVLSVDNRSKRQVESLIRARELVTLLSIPKG